MATIRFYDGRNNELTDEYASVDATYVEVTARGLGKASVLWSDDLASWLLYDTTGVSNASSWADTRWGSWQDAIHEVLGVDCSIENPI